MTSQTKEEKTKFHISSTEIEKLSYVLAKAS
jgi:hypothetical protein